MFSSVLKNFRNLSRQNFGQFDFRFYDLDQEKALELVVGAAKKSAPRIRLESPKKKQQDGIKGVNLKYKTEHGSLAISVRVNVIELEESREFILLNVLWQADYNVGGIILSFHEELYTDLCKTAKLYPLPARTEKMRKSKNQDAITNSEPVQYQLSTLVSSQYRPEKYIGNYVDETTPGKHSYGKQSYNEHYWWDLSYDFAKPSYFCLQLAAGCPASKDGLESRIDLYYERSSENWMQFNYEIFTQNNRLANAIANAAICDFCLLFSDLPACHRGFANRYFKISGTPKEAMALAKEYLLYVETAGELHAEKKNPIQWQHEFEELEEIGELRFIHPAGVRLSIRIGGKVEKAAGYLLPVSIEWILLSAANETYLKFLVSSTVSAVFNLFGMQNQELPYSLEYLVSEPDQKQAQKVRGIQANANRYALKKTLWPTPQDYQEAMQNSAQTLIDVSFEGSSVLCNKLGLPQAISGGFASVYRVHKGDRDWALRCFLNPIHDQELRYSQISRFIESDSLPYTLGFEYFDQGIIVNGDTYPLVRMPWVEGLPLHAYIEKKLKDRNAVLRLRNAFIKMHHDLLAEGVAHCDLQHGNIIVNNDELFLVDYDNVFIGPLEGLPSNELGHANYQHPDRNKTHYGLYVDNFSAWVIDTSLLCILYDDRVWQAVNGGDECLIFRARDYRKPGKSELFSYLLKVPEPILNKRARLLIEFLKLPPEEIPVLNEDY